MITELPGLPSRVFVDHDGTRLGPADRQGSRFSSGRTAVELTAASAGLGVVVTCPTGPLTRVVLRWETTFPPIHFFSVIIGNAATAICNGAISSLSASCPGILPRIMRPAGEPSWPES